MRPFLFGAGAAAVLLPMLIGCSGPAPTGREDFPNQSLLTLTSQSGAYQIELRTSPDQPPTRGDVAAQLTITNARSGAPEAGLDLTVVPWMPAMGHGTSVQPTISETAAGTYLVDHLILFMPGDWQLRTELGGTLSDHVTPTLEIR